MLTLILLLVAGGLLAFVAQSNLEPVSVVVGPYTLADVPLFYVIICSLLAGLLLSYVFHLVRDISSKLALRGKSKEISRTKDEVLELTKRVHQLELENQKLKLGHKEDAKPLDTKSL